MAVDMIRIHLDLGLVHATFALKSTFPAFRFHMDTFFFFV